MPTFAAFGMLIVLLTGFANTGTASAIVAVGMADGYAQATRTAGMVNLHSATGLGHSLGAVFTAYKNR